jgi:signal peptidase I
MKIHRHINSKRLIVALALVAVAAGFARSSVGTCSIVEGVSMYPTFKPRDVVRTRATQEKLQRGDVVILTDSPGDRAIKRIIGLPGETVTIYHGFVYINGRRLSEPYLPERTFTFESNSRVLRRADWRMADDEYFVMGDNRLRSADSRAFGGVPQRNIHGIVDVPANSVKPGFCPVILTKSGQPVVVEENSGWNHARTALQPTGSKS